MIKNIQNIIQKSYIMLAYIVILITVTLINVDHIINNNILVNTLLVILGLIVMLAINKTFVNKIKDSTIGKNIIVLLLIFLILQIISAYFFKVNYNWDFKWIMDTAKDIATTGTTQNMYYFKIYPNNWGALIIALLGMKITLNNEIGAYAINIFSIFLSVLFSVLSAKKLGGNKLAFNLMILVIGCAPLFLYSPIIYTDSLSVAFPIATFYFWLLSRENREKSSKKYIRYTIIMSLVGVIGYCIKPVAGIILVAVLIDEILTNNIKSIKQIAIVIIIFILVSTSFNILCEKFIIKDSRKNDLEIPITHWIMMGLNKPEAEGGTSIGYGAYSQNDVDYTNTSGNYEEKKVANIKKIEERLQDFGVSGYLNFLMKKFDYVWNDGSYYSLKLIGWDTINTTSIPYKIVLDKRYNQVFANYMTSFNNCLFFIIFVGLIISICKKGIKQEIRVLGISIVGIAIFLLIWEARSRYIYFMIPIFCTFSAYEFLILYNYIESNIKNIKEKIINIYKLKVKRSK